jgi:hypothetical protein
LLDLVPNRRSIVLIHVLSERAVKVVKVDSLSDDRNMPCGITLRLRFKPR